MGWCARVLHMGPPLAQALVHKGPPSCTRGGTQAVVHKGALLHKGSCTSALHKGPPLAQGWCGAQVCCTRGHLLHKGWCSRLLHDDPGFAQAWSTSTSCCTRIHSLHLCHVWFTFNCTLLHESLAQERRFPCSVAQAVARGQCVARGLCMRHIQQLAAALCTDAL